MKTFQISEDIKNVSRVGLGCMRLTEKKTDQEVRAIVDTALENGINFFDHADIYAAGEAEAAFGKILTPSLREQMVIQTKCAIRPGICFDFSKASLLCSKSFLCFLLKSFSQTFLSNFTSQAFFI